MEFDSILEDLILEFRCICDVIKEKPTKEKFMICINNSINKKLKVGNYENVPKC